MIYQAILYYTYSQWLYIILAVVSYLSGLTLGILNKNFVKVYVTSFLGAFFIVRGISFIFGGYPSELVTFDLLARNIEPAYDAIMYVYFAGLIVVTLLGVIV